MADKDKSEVLVCKALEIINQHVTLSPDGILEIKDNTPVMHAAELFRQASSLDPTDPHIHFACVSALFVGGQFKSAEDEIKQLLDAYPKFHLGKFFLTDMKSGNARSSTIFSVPEWKVNAKMIPAKYIENTTDFTILPTREQFYPRVVVFEKDSNRWWTQNKLKRVQAEIAVVLDSDIPNVSAIYRRCIGPGLKKPDVQEYADVPQSPENHISKLAWEYLTLVDFVEVVVVDIDNNVLLTQRVALSNKNRCVLGHVQETLRRMSGARVSPQKKMSALLNYKNKVDIDEIERGYFCGEKIF